MLITPHTVAGNFFGLAIASLFGGVWKAVIAFILGIISHFILDALPHWNPDADKIISFEEIIYLFLDFFLSLGLLLVLLNKGFNREILFYSYLGAILPDIFLFAEHFFVHFFTPKKKKKRFSFHYLFHKDIQWDIHQVYGLLTQVALTTVLLLIMLNFY